MNNKRSSQDNKMSSNPFPVWKEQPPGPEQKELEKLFSANQIDPTATADSVRKSNEKFQKFSSTVFSEYFRKTKAKIGLCATVARSDSGASDIAELGSINSLFTSQQSREAPQSFDEHPPVEFRNPPFWTWVYTDHLKKLEFVCVAVLTTCGSENNKFIISEDGMQVTMRYTWPTAMYKATELFAQARDGKDKLTLYHHALPKVHAFMSHLLDSGVTDKSSPVADLLLTCQKKVQRTTTSWKKEAVRSNDANIILLELTAFQKELFIEEADTTIEF